MAPSLLLALSLLSLSLFCPSPHVASSISSSASERTTLDRRGASGDATWRTARNANSCDWLHVPGEAALHGLRLRGGRYRAVLDGGREQRKKELKKQRKRGKLEGTADGVAGGDAGSKMSALKEALRAKIQKNTLAPEQTTAGEITKRADGATIHESGANGKKKHRPGSFQALGLDDTLLRGMYHAGYKFPTPVQRKVIPHVLSGSHVVAMARTGSGKTAAFLAPMIQRLVSLTAKERGAGRVLGVKGLVILPTRELALQAFTFFKTYAKFTPISACLLAGGESIDAQFSALAANPEVIFATPGRLLQILNEVSSLNLRSVRLVCVCAGMHVSTYNLCTDYIYLHVHIYLYLCPYLYLHPYLYQYVLIHLFYT